MRPNIVRKKDVILNFYVTGQGRSVGENIVVANEAIMRDMHTNHEEVARTDACDCAFAARPMQSAKLPNQIIVADDQAARFAFELHILRFAAQDSVFENAVASTYFGELLNDRVGADYTPFAKGYVVFDNGIRANAYVGRNHSRGTD